MRQQSTKRNVGPTKPKKKKQEKVQSRVAGLVKGKVLLGVWRWS